MKKIGLIIVVLSIFIFWLSFISQQFGIDWIYFFCSILILLCSSGIHFYKNIWLRLLLMFMSMVLLIFCVIHFNNIMHGHKFRHTTRQVIDFSEYVEHYTDFHHELPGPGIDDVVKALLADEESSKRINKECSMFISNKDSWGNEFIYQRDEDNKRYAVVRSKGRNGRDENGQGDDIQCEIEMTDPELMRKWIESQGLNCCPKKEK